MVKKDPPLSPDHLHAAFAKIRAENPLTCADLDTIEVHVNTRLTQLATRVGYALPRPPIRWNASMLQELARLTAVEEEFRKGNLEPVGSDFPTTENDDVGSW